LNGCLEAGLGEGQLLEDLVLDEAESRPNEGLLLFDFQSLNRKMSKWIHTLV